MFGPKFPGKRVQPLSAAGAKEKACTGAGESPGTSQADSGRCSGDKDKMIVQIEHDKCTVLVRDSIFGRFRLKDTASDEEHGIHRIFFIPHVALCHNAVFLYARHGRVSSPTWTIAILPSVMLVRVLWLSV
jgi:hypothetical protein